MTPIVSALLLAASLGVAIAFVKLRPRRTWIIRINPEPFSAATFDCIREDGHAFRPRVWRDGVCVEEWEACEACGLPRHVASRVLAEAQDLDERLALLDSQTFKIHAPLRAVALDDQVIIRPEETVEFVVDVENRTDELQWCSLYAERDLPPGGAVARWLDRDAGESAERVLSTSDAG
jgi:hypothetical protein